MRERKSRDCFFKAKRTIELRVQMFSVVCCGTGVRFVENNLLLMRVNLSSLQMIYCFCFFFFMN